jgi:hypothetical protein
MVFALSRIFTFVPLAPPIMRIEKEVHLTAEPSNCAKNKPSSPQKDHQAGKGEQWVVVILLTKIRLERLAVIQKTFRQKLNHFETAPLASKGASVTRRNPRSQCTRTHSWSRRLRSL